MNDLAGNIKKIMFVFLVLFITLISYVIFYFSFKGPEIEAKTANKRLWAKRNEVLRGTIYDRNMKPLTKSEREGTLTQKREYIEGELFAHSLGYVDIVYGITGLEAKYDKELMADNSLSYVELLKLFKNKEKEKEKVGHSLKVTLDYNIQKAASDLLGNNRGSIVALNPKTGEILAMISKPSFNPNDLKNQWDSLTKDSNLPLINRAVAGLYPPGSVFKIITSISGLENLSGIRERIFNDTGKIVFNANYSLSNYGGTANGNIDLKEAFVRSSNVVFGTIAMDLGNDKLKSTAEKFMFNKDIDADGIVINNSRFPSIPKTEPGNIAQSGIGQSSILASPMQMALVASTIANKGVMMKPKLVSEIMTYDGEKIKDISPEVLTKVTSAENANLLKDYMREVVTNGTGKSAAVNGVTVCGKTGTADHDDKPNVDEPPHSWFVGFAPYEDPTIAIAVIVEEGGTGGGIAAKIASGVFAAAFK